MTRMNSKDQILKEIDTERHRLEVNIADFTPVEMETRGVIGNWTIKDLLAHLAEWETMFMEWYAASQRGEIPHPPGEGLSWSDLDVVNQRIYEKHNQKSLEEVINFFHTSYERVHSLVEKLPEEELFLPGKSGWTGKWLLADFVTANTSLHYRWAKTEIRKWKRKR
jgi:hypothetical protein